MPILQNMFLIAVLLLLGCDARSGVSEPHDDAATTTVFHDVNVVPMDSERVLHRQSVIVRDGVIAEIGAVDEVRLPAGARVVPANGAYLMPGLADFHVHLRSPEELLSYLAHGVTTIVHLSGAMGGAPDLLRYRRQIAEGDLVGPRLFTSGPILDGDPPVFGSVSEVVTTPDEGRRAVALQKAAGYDFIKVYNNLAPDVLTAVVEAAHDHEMAVVGHIPRAGGRSGALQRALDAGLDLIAHGEEYFFTYFYEGVDDLLDRGQIPFRDSTRISAVVRMTRSAGAAVTPNLSFAAMTQKQLDSLDAVLEDSEIRYLHRDVVDMWRAQNPMRRSDLDRFVRRERAKYAHLKSLTKALADEGVLLLLGTDSSAPGMFPGRSAHLELAELVAAGLTPYEALLTGTRNPGFFMDEHTPTEAPSFGVVGVGRRADLLLVEDNPLESVVHASRIRGVMAAGRWYTPDELHALREEALTDAGELHGVPEQAHADAGELHALREEARTDAGLDARERVAQPADAQHPFKTAEGLEVTLWAESPMFYNPTNIDVDARGRIWVAEAVNYRTFNAHGEQARRHADGDRIVILDDTDGDGTADSSKVFVQDQDLHAPLGIAVIGNRVIVSSSPSVIVYTDEDRDDRPEKKEVFLTGFGGFDHDHGLHAFVAGPDGRWYFNAGNAGPHVVTDRSGWTLRSGSVYTGGTPYNTENRPGMVSDDGRVWTGGVALRIEPDGTGLEVLAHNFRNAYELAVDSYGNLWQNDNDDEVVACRTSWVMEGGNMGFFSADGSRTWRADRRPRQDAFTAHWHQDDPGVIPAGDRTGAGAPAGIVVYEGDAFGSPGRGMLLSADAGRNLIFRYETAREGAGFRLQRSVLMSTVEEPAADYVWNADIGEDPSKRFRPSDVAVGTDGAIYVADWHDAVVGGHAMRDRIGRGRIYRITPRGADLEAPSLDLSSTEGQIRALLSPAVNVRYAGFIRLKRRGETVLADVKALLERENPYHRARAVWLLAQLGPSGLADVETLLDDPDPNIRITAFRALRRVRKDLSTEVRRLAGDASPAVRREVAVALRDVPADARVDVVAQLAEAYDGRDRWYLEALGLAADGAEERIYEVLRDGLGAGDPLRWDDRFTGLAWRLHPISAVDDLKTRAAAESLSEAERLRAIDAIGFVSDRTAAQAMADLTRSSLPDVASRAAWWLSFRSMNEWRGYPVEGAAPSATVESERASEEMVRAKKVLFDTTHSIIDRADAASKVAEDPVAAGYVLALLASRPASPNIKNVVRTAVFDNPDQTVRVLARQLLNAYGEDEYDIQDVAALTGRPEFGRGVFWGKCAVCHRVDDGGGDVGPDLSRIGTKLDRAELLEAVTNPEDVLAHGYEPYVVTTTDGRVIIGFVLSGGDTVVVKDARGARHALERDDVEMLERLGAGIMPDPRELRLSEQDVADVAAFLTQQR